MKQIALKGRIYIYIYLIFFNILYLSSSSQVWFAQSIRVIPCITFGYTSGKGINVGADLGVSFIDYKINDIYSYSGVNVSFSIFTQKMQVYKSGYFRVKSINFLNVVNNMQITKLGVSKTSLKWGMNNRNTNRSKKWGFFGELGFIPVKNYPYLGVRYFMPINACLGLNDDNPKFIFAGYQYPFMIYKNQALSPDIETQKKVFNY